MLLPARRLRVFAFLAGVAMLSFSAIASADPPARVGRLGYLAGDVSFSPAGENDWLVATINRPLTPGDRLWADARSRAEIQVGGAMVRMSADTGVSVVNLDDRIAQLQLTQGTLNVRVRRMEAGQLFEVDTPNLAFTLRSPGEYRIEVDPDGRATTIFVRKGAGEVYSDGTAYLVDTRQAYRFFGTGLRQYEFVDAPRLDDFDQWSRGRDSALDNSRSARYVSPDVVGYQDLDAYGSWRDNESYGSVWVPNRVSVGWAPYSDGHWAWVAPWGWTWIDDAPWGYAVSHYGRWANLGGTWAWVPGPTRSRAYYAPALVAFVGGSNFQLAITSGNVGGIAWFPLAPREVYRPPYAASRRYVEHVNQSNTVVTNTVIHRTYNTTKVTNIVYANRRVPGAVVAVPTTVFVQSQPVARAVVQAPRASITSVPVAVAPHAVPTERSVRGAAAQRDSSPSRSFERPVVARSAPPATRLGFAARQRQELTDNPGQPLDNGSRREVKPATSAPTTVVNVVPAREAPTTVRPPRTAPDASPARDRGNADERRTPAAPVSATPAAAAEQLPEQRGNSGKDGRRERRGPPASVPQPVNTPQTVATPQAAPPSESRESSWRRDRGEQRRQPVDAPAAAGVAAPAPVAAPARMTQPPEQRGTAERREIAEQRRQAVAPPQLAAPATPVMPPQVAPPTPIAHQPGKTAPGARPAEHPLPVAAEKSPPADPGVAPRAESREQKHNPWTDQRKERRE